MDVVFGYHLTLLSSETFTLPSSKVVLLLLYSHQVPSLLNLKTGELKHLLSNNYSVSNAVFSTNGTSIYAFGRSFGVPEALLQINPFDCSVVVIKNADTPIIENGYVSIPKHISFPSGDGTVQIHGYLYLPKVSFV